MTTLFKKLVYDGDVASMTWEVAHPACENAELFVEYIKGDEDGIVVSYDVEFGGDYYTRDGTAPETEHESLVMTASGKKSLLLLHVRDRGRVNLVVTTPGANAGSVKIYVGY